MNAQQIISQELEAAATVLQQFMADAEQLQRVEAAARLMADALQAGNKIISCGNGGSHCDAMHFAEELSGRFRENRKALAAIAVSDPSHISCTANDFGFEFIFSRFVEGLGQAGDVLVGISTSGNSANVLRAAAAAKAKGMQVVVLTGKDGGQLAPLADVALVVPHFGYADRIQEVHIKLIHIMILLIEQYVAK